MIDKALVYFPGSTVLRGTEWESWLLFIVLFLVLSTGLGYAQVYMLKRLVAALTHSYHLVFARIEAVPNHN